MGIPDDLMSGYSGLKPSRSSVLRVGVWLLLVMPLALLSFLGRNRLQSAGSSAGQALNTGRERLASLASRLPLVGKFMQ